MHDSAPVATEKRVLVTGAAGFVGGHVVQFLLRNTDWSVICLVRLGNSGDLRRLLPSLCSRLTIVYHDLKYCLHESIREQIGSVDYVLHLAANSHVDRSIAYPREFFEDNVIGTVNLLDYVRQYQPEARLINFSTDEVYGPAPGPAFREEDRFRPSNPYAASKAAQSLIGVAYAVTYGMDILNTYTMNIFGEGQNPEKLIPKAIQMAKLRKPMPVFAELLGEKLTAVGSRHWLYAGNVGPALLFLLEHGVKGEHYNIVGTDELTNEDVVLAVNRFLKTEPLIEYVDWHKVRPGHDRRYAIDGTKLRKLGWSPSIGFQEGIERIALGGT